MNMFPHSLTVYHHTDDDTYVCNIVQEAYWYGSENITLKVSDHITVELYRFDCFKFKHLLETAGMNAGRRRMDESWR